MLEKPDLPDQFILSRLHEAYGFQASRLTFLPLGADFNTAVYRADAAGSAAFFVKLRKGSFDDITVSLPHYLHSQGLQAIIAPLETTSHQLSASLGEYRLILYPFITGEDGYTDQPSSRQWLAFGAALKTVHTAQLPPALRQRIPHEDYSPDGRNLVRMVLTQVEEHFHSPPPKPERFRSPNLPGFKAQFTDPVATRLAAFMFEKRDEIRQVIDRADQLALELQQRPLARVLCHADIHPGNLHLAPDGAFYLVDWDNPLFAPKERDLALLGGCTTWSDPGQVELFYQGYCPGSLISPSVDRRALAYYRLERIVQDMMEFCKQLLLSEEGDQDREQSYQYFTSNFLPGHEIDLALHAA